MPPKKRKKPGKPATGRKEISPAILKKRAINSIKAVKDLKEHDQAEYEKHEKVLWTALWSLFNTVPKENARIRRFAIKSLVKLYSLPLKKGYNGNDPRLSSTKVLKPLLLKIIRDEAEAQEVRMLARQSIAEIRMETRRKVKREVRKVVSDFAEGKEIKPEKKDEFINSIERDVIHYGPKAAIEILKDLKDRPVYENERGKRIVDELMSIAKKTKKGKGRQQ